MAHIEVMSVIDLREAIPVSAGKLAQAILREIQNQREPIHVSLCGLRGVPPTFFNTLLLALLAEVEPRRVAQDVHFEFDSESEKAVYERSWQAVTKPAA